MIKQKLSRTTIKHTFSLGKKKGRKCKRKDMIYPFNRNEKRKKERKKKERQEEGECQHRKSRGTTCALTCTMVFFCSNASWWCGAGGPNTWCVPTWYQIPVGPTCWAIVYVVPGTEFDVGATRNSTRYLPGTRCIGPPKAPIVAMMPARTRFLTGTIPGSGGSTWHFVCRP